MHYLRHRLRPNKQLNNKLKYSHLINQLIMLIQMYNIIIKCLNSLKRVNRILRVIKIKVEVSNLKIHKANKVLRILQMLEARIQHHRVILQVVPPAIPPVIPQAVPQAIPLAIPLVIHPETQHQVIRHQIQPNLPQLIDYCKILHIFKMIQ